MDSREASAYIEANRALWDSWAGLHVGSRFYDVAGFKAGRCTLDDVERALPGDVRGRSLLHLQCHFGLSTLSWARLGAVATGVDFSGVAIEAARALSSETGIAAEFVQSDIYELSKNLSGTFDIVFASHGVLPWLPDLDAWAAVAARFLKPGGTFCLVESHPFVQVLDERSTERELRVVTPWFGSGRPTRFEEQGSYAVPDAPITSITHEWTHSLADVFGAVIRAGIRIAEFREYPYMGWPAFPWMRPREGGFWEFPEGAPQLPLMFAIRGVRE